MKKYSTVQVAKLVGITSDTLHRWIRERCISAPRVQSLGGMRIRFWSQEELERVRKYKAEHYQKKPNRKKPSKKRKVKS